MKFLVEDIIIELEDEVATHFRIVDDDIMNDDEPFPLVRIDKNTMEHIVNFGRMFVENPFEIEDGPRENLCEFSEEYLEFANNLSNEDLRLLTLGSDYIMFDMLFEFSCIVSAIRIHVKHCS